jgi:hypothetical protein
VIWVPIGAWCAAVAVAVVLLGFCGYEIAWKTKRLQGDLAQLRRAQEQLDSVRAGLAETQARVAATGLTPRTRLG